MLFDSKAQGRSQASLRWIAWAFVCLQCSSCKPSASSDGPTKKGDMQGQDNSATAGNAGSTESSTSGQPENNDSTILPNRDRAFAAEHGFGKAYDTEWEGKVIRASGAFYSCIKFSTKKNQCIYKRVLYKSEMPQAKLYKGTCYITADPEFFGINCDHINSVNCHPYSSKTPSDSTLNTISDPSKSIKLGQSKFSNKYGTIEIVPASECGF